MRVHDALEQLDAIHEHLTKAEVYRGFRVPGVALVGAVGVLAAAAQPSLGGSDGPTGFVVYWLVVAAGCALLGGGTAAHAYALREDEFARRRTRRVFAQFAPCLFAGGVITAAVLRAGAESVASLPGLWAILFGLGVISARPYLPKGIGVVGLGYLVVGAVLLARAATDSELSGWAVGGVFGLGHFATAFVLWCDRTRESNG
jgi:protein-S-isoprenylcysteine O-methyltransferase Ste14